MCVLFLFNRINLDPRMDNHTNQYHHHPIHIHHNESTMDNQNNMVNTIDDKILLVQYLLIDSMLISLTLLPSLVAVWYLIASHREKHENDNKGMNLWNKMNFFCCCLHYGALLSLCSKKKNKWISIKTQK